MNPNQKRRMESTPHVVFTQVPEVKDKTPEVPKVYTAVPVKNLYGEAFLLTLIVVLVNLVGWADNWTAVSYPFMFAVVFHTCCKTITVKD